MITARPAFICHISASQDRKEAKYKKRKCCYALNLTIQVSFLKAHQETTVGKEGTRTPALNRVAHHHILYCEMDRLPFLSRRHSKDLFL